MNWDLDAEKSKLVETQLALQSEQSRSKKLEQDLNDRDATTKYFKSEHIKLENHIDQLKKYSEQLLRDYTSEKAVVKRLERDHDLEQKAAATEREESRQLASDALEVKEKLNRSLEQIAVLNDKAKNGFKKLTF